MSGLKKLFVGTFVVGGTLLVAGCQEQAPPSHTMAATAARCDKCNVTWVQEPNTAGGKQGAVTTYNWAKKDACPDCKNAVDTFFATGNLQHSCKACGGNMTACEGH